MSSSAVLQSPVTLSSPIPISNYVPSRSTASQRDLHNSTPRTPTDNRSLDLIQFGDWAMESGREQPSQQQFFTSIPRGRALPTAAMINSRFFLLMNVIFADFPDCPSNRFTSLMYESNECGYCHSKFHTLEMLKRHLSHADHPVWICCHNLYRTKRLRDDHRRDYLCQSTPVPGTCALEAFYQSPTKNKFTTDMKDGKCGYCGRENGSLTALRNHLQKEGLHLKGHPVWYSHGRFFEHLKEMNDWKEVCQKGEREEELAWLEIRDELSRSSRERDEEPAATWIAS